MTVHTPNINRRHHNGEHNRWCQKRQGNNIVCKFTTIAIKELPKQ